MLLTPEMFAAGLVAAVCQVIAHYAMRNRTYITPVPRYVVGVMLGLAPWSAALAVNRAQEPIIGIWFVFGASGVATWIAYELERRTATEADADRIIGYIASEHED